MSTSEYPAPHLRGRWPRPAAHGQALSVELGILGVLIIVAAVIRIVTLDNQSLWADEALTAYEATLPFGAMLHTVAHIETTPPLYFVLVWGWAKLFGPGAVAIRSFSAVAGVALVPVTWRCGRELVSPRAGLLAAAFVAVNPFMIWYSQEARAYMLLALVCGASFLWFIRACEDGSRRNLAWWALFSAAALMTHFFASFLVAPEALWLLWRLRSRSAVVAAGAVAAVQLAVLPFAVTDSSNAYGAGWIASHPLLGRIATTAIEWGASNLYRRVTTPAGLLGGAAVALIVALLVWRGGDPRTRRGAAVAAALVAVVFTVPLLLAVAGNDYFLSRNEMPAFVPAVVLVAAACAAPRARVAGGVFAAVLLILFSLTAISVQTHPYLQRPDWRAVAHALGPTLVPRAVLTSDGTTADPLKIYLPGVSWVQPQHRGLRVDEVDVVGATKRLALSQTSAFTPVAPAGGGPATDLDRPSVGRTVPRSISPPGAQLEARFRVDNWVVARFALKHPQTLTPLALKAMAPRFFRHTPASLLVFIQRRTG